MKKQQQQLNLTTNAPAKAVGEYEFEPIRGQPMLRWNGKRAFTATSYFPAQEKERHGDEVNGWMNRIYWGDDLVWDPTACIPCCNGLAICSHVAIRMRGKGCRLRVRSRRSLARSL